MNKLKNSKLYFIAIYVSFFNYFISAQQVITTAGGDGKSSTAQVSWTLGEFAIETFVKDKSTITQGEQQPGLQISSIVVQKESELRINVFPNPTTLKISLSIEKGNIGNIRYKVFDIDGHLYENKKVISKKTDIPFFMMAKGTYILKVYEKDNEIRDFKIIKQ